MIVRAIRDEDIRDIYEIKTMKGVRETILGIKSYRYEDMKNYMDKLNKNDHILVSEIEKDGISKVVGIVHLNVFVNPRAAHCASLMIMVHKEYQGRGIGKVLMKEILNISDNWLMLKRIELGVFSNNKKAINLYKSFGFVVEGIKKYELVRNGNYEDETIMARYNI